MNEDDTKTVVFFYDMRCPLTGEIMVDPVVASDGRTYERDAIQSVIDDRANETVTNEAWLEQVPKLSSKHLYKNMLALQAIKIFSVSIEKSHDNTSKPS